MFPFPEWMSSFQKRVQKWMYIVFDPSIIEDKQERNARFLEESLELVQSLGMTEKEALHWVRYVFNRPIGETKQEVGGVMVTLNTLCAVNGMNPEVCGSQEMDRVDAPEIIEKIRAKQAQKPKFEGLNRRMTKEEFCKRFPWIDPTVGAAGADPNRKNSDLDLKPGVFKKSGHIAVCCGSRHKGMDYMIPIHSEDLEHVEGLNWEIFSISSEGTIEGQTYVWGSYVEGLGMFNVMVPKEFTRELTDKERDAWAKKKMGMYGSHSGKLSYTMDSGVASSKV